LAELLRDRAAVAHGLSVMATEMLFHDLPSMLREVVGERQAEVLLERLASRAAERGFREFVKQLGVEGPMEPLQVLTVFLRPRSGKKVHPFQVASRVEAGGGRVRLLLAERLGHVEAALLAGVVAGVLAAVGHPARAVTERSAAQHLCRSGERPEYIVYPEDTAIAVEGLVCESRG